MMMYKNTCAKVRSFFDIIAGVLQGDTLASFLFIICLDYVLCTFVDKIKNLGFTLTKYRSSRHPSITITDADYADNSFTYLGSNIASTETDVKTWIGKAWSAVWKSSIPDDIKRDLFQAAVETMVVYGSSSWTLAKELEAKLDVTYMRML